MSKLLRTTAAIGAVAMMSLSPVAAFADTSLGMFQTTDRKMDYDLTLCGTDGKHLCVKLDAARGTADTGKVHPFIGKLIVDNAKPDGNNKWNGTMHLAGRKLGGSLTLSPGKNFVMHGCVYVVVCQDFTLIPAQ